MVTLAQFLKDDKEKKPDNRVRDMLTGKVNPQNLSQNKSTKLADIMKEYTNKPLTSKPTPYRDIGIVNKLGIIAAGFNDATIGRLAPVMQAGFRATGAAVNTVAQSKLGQFLGLGIPGARNSVYGEPESKAFYGEDPGTAETQGKETLSILQNGQTNFWKDPLGYTLNKVGENLSRNKNTASGVGFLLAGLDFTGAGKVDDTLKVLTKVDDIGKAAKELRKIGVIEENIAKYAPKVVAAKTEEGVKKLLDTIQEAQKINPLSGIRKFAPEVKEKLVENVDALKTEFEKLKGGKLTHKEIIEAANTSTIMPKVISKEQSKAAIASVQKVKQNLAAMAEGKEVSKDFIEQLRIIKSQASDAGRKLNAFNIDVSPLAATKAEIIGKLTELGIETDKILAAAKGVDFSNSKQVAKFYREFVPYKYGELLDEWRYGNLLSSPKTHIINTASNALQATLLNPATKLASGLVDNVAHLFGKEQEHYIREVPEYVRGLTNSFGDAFSDAWKAFRGNSSVTNLDLHRIPTNSKITLVQRQFLQALEAGDAFFRTLIKGGEREALAAKYTKQGKGFTLESLEEEVAKKAEYFVFRKALDTTNKTGQGTLLTGIDKITNGVMKMRDNKLMGWLVPFVQTPVNILKQGIEYSPLGVLTLPKNANKVEQLGKTMVGSLVFALGGEMALHNRTTWAAPTNPKEKELFYASGQQPYSVKIGDKWYSYSKIGPLAYPLAMAAAMKYYWKDDPKASTATNTERAVEIVGGIAKFFGDQSYVQGISEAVGLVSGETRGESIIKTFENLAGQGIPLVGLQRWVNQIIDPIYRQTPHDADIKTILKNLEAQLLTRSKIQEPYLNPEGEESKRQYPAINAFNPFTVTKENKGFSEDLEKNRKLQEVNKLKDAQYEEDKARIEPILEHVTQLEADGKVDEAQAIKDGLSDEDWEIYKNIRETRKEAEVKKLQADMLDVYKDVVKRRAENSNDDANGVQDILDAMTEDEYKAYKQVESLVEGAGGVDKVKAWFGKIDPLPLEDDYFPEIPMYGEQSKDIEGEGTLKMEYTASQMRKIMYEQIDMNPKLTKKQKEEMKAKLQFDDLPEYFTFKI